MRLLARLAILSSLTSCAVAHADTLSTFAIKGSSIVYAMGGDTNTVSGTATVNITTGLFQSLSFIAGGIVESGIDAAYGNTVYVGGDAAAFTVSGTSLVNFAGDNFNLNGPNDLYVGQLTLLGSSDSLPTSPLAVTPEPASLLLLSTGLMGVALLRRRQMSEML